MKYDIGFLGGGQLARMSIQAAQRMGMKCLSLDPGDVTPASGVSDSLVGALNDVGSVAQVFRNCQWVTLENEFIPSSTVETAMHAAGRGPDCLSVSARCLATIQDKLLQREAYEKAGVATPKAGAICGDDSEPKFPLVLKARFGGYDGKGIRYARDRSEFEGLADLWKTGDWLAEEFVPFRRELAVMVCRSQRQTLCYPTVETVQSDHVCDLVYPADTDASGVAIAAVEAVEGYGIFGVELFETETGALLVNEIAPRPHNTGHYTLDWGGPSQFEAHVRLVLGLPVPTPQGDQVCMANLIGQPSASEFREGTKAAIEGDPAIYVHWYGKAESRTGRKMGHLNAVGDRCVDRARAARERFYRAWTKG